MGCGFPAHACVSVCDCAWGLGSCRGCLTVSRAVGTVSLPPGGTRRLKIVRAPADREAHCPTEDRARPVRTMLRRDPTPSKGSLEVEGQPGTLYPKCVEGCTGNLFILKRKERTKPTPAPNSNQQLTNLFFLTSGSCHGYPHAWFPRPHCKWGGLEQALSSQPPRVAVAWAGHSVAGRAGNPRGFLGPCDAMFQGRN